MRVETKSCPERQRQVLTGMIVSDTVVGRLENTWTKGSFDTKWANLIGGWCIKHYRKHGKAPNRDIQSIYNIWAEKSQDSESIQYVGNFLQSLSGTYRKLRKKINPELILDWAYEVFNESKLESLKEDLSNLLTVGKLDEALAKIDGFKRIDPTGTSIIDVLGDRQMIKSAFTESLKPVIRYPGDLGKFFSKALRRDCFVSFMGPEKRGKSFVLMQLAIDAVLQKRRVLYFDCGDMSANQVLRRMTCRIAEHPIEAGTILIPNRIFRDVDDEFASVSHDKKKFKKNLDYKRAWKGCRKFLQDNNLKDDYLKLSCHPNSTLSIKQIDTIINNLTKEGWTPDLIVVDYADILAYPASVKEYRQQIDYNWKAMRTMSQERHCLVVTATQTKASSYGAKALDMTHFADDKRKFGHVTAMIGLNATEMEKEIDVMRLNYTALREGRFVSSDFVHIAGCRALGNLFMKSTF